MNGIFLKENSMILAIPSIGALLLALLVAYLLLAAPTGSLRSLLLTAINIIIFLVIVYFILYLFGIVIF
jgi:hypothetical protein